MPVASGRHPCRADASAARTFFGDDVVLQFGGGTIGHPMGIARPAPPPTASHSNAMVLARNEGRDIAHEGPEILRAAAQLVPAAGSRPSTSGSDVSFNYTPTDTPDFVPSGATPDEQNEGELDMHITQGCILVPAAADGRADRGGRRNIASDKGWAIEPRVSPTIPIPATPIGTCGVIPMFDNADASRADNGAERVPEGLRRPLYPARRLRQQPWMGVRVASHSSSIVPRNEPGFRLERQEAAGRRLHYTTRSYAADAAGGRSVMADAGSP